MIRPSSRIAEFNMWATFLGVINGVIIIFPMVRSEEVSVLILARGGSKGVHLKNLQTVGGKSLLVRAIDTAKQAELSVTVSTDHPVIALEALKSGAKVFPRNRITATDWAPSIWGAAEFVATKPDLKILVLLQATSPFIRAEKILNALKLLERFDCVFSVTRSYKLRWQIDHKGAVVVPVNFKLHARPRRQDCKGELIETGAFYVSRRKLIESGFFQNNNCSIIETTAPEDLEVDNYYDLEVANAVLGANLF